MSLPARQTTKISQRPTFKAPIRFLIAVISFAAGSFLTARLLHMQQVSADSNRVFELNIYHAVPGKVPALVSRFSDASKLQAEHHLNVIGYWVPEGNPAWANTFVYIVAHSSPEEGKRNWQAFHADPQFQKYLQSEHADKLIQNVDQVLMRPTDFSALQ